MGRKKSERVRMMKQEFMKLHQEGYGIREIASKFKLSFKTVYRYLGEIAAENGVSRDSLLSKHSYKNKLKETFYDEESTLQTTFDELQEELNEAKKSLEIATTEIDTILEEKEG